jgi:hypothetical protein
MKGLASIDSVRVHGKGEAATSAETTQENGRLGRGLHGEIENPAPVFASSPSNLRDVFHPVRACEPASMTRMISETLKLI